ncbi:MAG: transketolase [Anaerolineaceae bacterium]
MTPEKIAELEEIARQLRVDSLQLIHRRGAGHPGGALSAAEIIAVLYFHVLRINPAEPAWDDRDRFILSKGHASAALKKLSYRTYVLLGDGECQAGIVWEGAMTAAKYHLSNLTAIVDCNDVQLDGPVHEVMPLEPFGDKWSAYGWHMIEVNGHSVRQVAEALELASEVHDRPTVILAHTTKGKGVSFMENQSYWHGNVPNTVQLNQALIELGEVTHG